MWAVVMFLYMRLVWLALIVYTAAAAIAEMTRYTAPATIAELTGGQIVLDDLQWLYVVLVATGVVATVYTALGGIQAVIWTDVAQFAVASLSNSIAQNAVLQLGGPAGISPNDAVGIFEKAAGGPFDVQHIPMGALEANFAEAQDPMQKSFAGLMLSYATTKPVDMTSLSEACPLNLRTVEAYAQSVS